MAEHSEVIKRIYRLTRRFKGIESKTFPGCGQVYVAKNFEIEKCLLKNIQKTTLLS